MQGTWSAGTFPENGCIPLAAMSGMTGVSTNVGFSHFLGLDNGSKPVAKNIHSSG